MTGARSLPALVVALALACTQPLEAEGPAPLAVNPARATADAPVTVEIAGRDFDAKVKTDLGDKKDDGDGLEATFAARLEPSGGGAAVPLLDVTFVDRHTLRATVPAGLARGGYRLVVTDPRGRRGALERAFRVVTSAASVSSFEVLVLEQPHAGAGFAVSLAALDASALVVDGFDGSVTLSDAAGALSATSVGPFVMGRYQAEVVISALVTADSLVATDALGHTGSSGSFDVLAGPAIALVFADPPVTVARGACSPRLELELRDALGHPAAAGADVGIQLQSAPPGLAFFADAGCTSAATTLTLLAGGTGAGFHFQTGTAGSVTVRALPSSLPSAVQVESVTP